MNPSTSRTAVIAVTVAALAGTAAATAGAAVAGPSGEGRIKNVIYLLGDGIGRTM